MPGGKPARQGKVASGGVGKPTKKATPARKFTFAKGEDPREEGIGRAELSRRLRKFLSPAAILQPDGSINQEYFRPRDVVYKDGDDLKSKVWDAAGEAALCQAIAVHGVGSWQMMRTTTPALEKWEGADLMFKARRLMGSQSLTRYKGWKGDADAIAAEREKNHEVGRLLRCWKGGVLVLDEEGKCEAELARRAKQEAGLPDAKGKKKASRPPKARG